MNDHPLSLSHPYPPAPLPESARTEAGQFFQRPRSPRLHVVLFLLTLLTTTMAGAMHAGVDPFSDPWGMTAGLPFSTTLLLILLCHELGHYALAAWHGIPTTLPYFIPGPPVMVGTFGAFIRMQGMPRSRRALFDIGAAGPWAGLVVAIPAVTIGLALSEVRPLSPEDEFGVVLGSSILFNVLSLVVLGVDPNSATILLHPVALAGWFGLFVTFLNLLPVGQLDGGHVVYALFGRGHRTIARIFLVVVLGMGFLGWEGWFLWAMMLAFVLRVDHPDTVDADTPLDPKRRAAAWLTIAVFFLTFMPVPLSVMNPPSQVRSRIERRAPSESWQPRNRRPGQASEGFQGIRRETRPNALFFLPRSGVPASL